MPIAQPFGLVRILGTPYIAARGRDPRPATPVVVNPFARISLAQLMNDSRPPISVPVDPGDPGTTDRDNLIYGTYRPQGMNQAGKPVTAGLITDRADLTPYNANTVDLLTLSASNITITRKEIFGQIKVTGSNILIYDSLVRGCRTTPTGETACIQLHDATHLNFVIRDSTIEPQWPNQNQDGIKGNNFTVERCHIYWCVDGIGIFNANGSTRPTNTRALGNHVEAHCYFHGPYYANSNGPKYLTTAGTYVAGTSASSVARPADGWTDNVHPDGNHNDGIQIQGGYGGMTRGLDGAWSGDGILCKGNNLDDYDAEASLGNPWGAGYPVPGTSSGLAGSKLGTQDNHRRQQQSPGLVGPVLTGNRLTSGKFATNGASLIVNPTVNALPFPSTAAPNKYTVVCEDNYMNNTTAGYNLQKGVMGQLKVSVLREKIGGDWFMFTPSSTATIYPFRIYDGSPASAGGVVGGGDHSGIQFGADVDGTPGLQTHRWFDNGNRYGGEGTLLTPGNRTGIVYS